MKCNFHLQIVNEQFLSYQRFSKPVPAKSWIFRTKVCCKMTLIKVCIKTFLFMAKVTLFESDSITIELLFFKHSYMHT